MNKSMQLSGGRALSLNPDDLNGKNFEDVDALMNSKDWFLF